MGVRRRSNRGERRAWVGEATRRVCSSEAAGERATWSG